MDTFNTLFGEAPSSVIHFRNPHSIGPVIVQMFMVFAAGLIVFGLVYVILLVLAITIHHFLYDRDPEKVPDFVKRSIQFSSSEESADEGHGDDGYEADEVTMNAPVDSRSLKSVKNKSRMLAETARKAENLDKFLSNDDRS